MTKLKLIPRAQRGTRIVPNGRQILPAGMTLDQYLNGSFQKLNDYVYASTHPAATGNAQPNDEIIQTALNTISGNGSVAPQVPQQPIAQQSVPAAKRNVQIPADALAGIQFKAPEIPLVGTDVNQTKLTAKQGGNQRTGLQNYFENRAANGEMNRALHGRNFAR